VTLEGAAPKLLVFDEAHAGQVSEAAPSSLPTIVVPGRTAGPAGRDRRTDQAGDDVRLREAIPYDEFVSTGGTRPLSPVTRSARSPRVVIHTSGTTGTPKGAARDTSAAGIGEIANLLEVIPYGAKTSSIAPPPCFIPSASRPSRSPPCSGRRWCFPRDSTRKNPCTSSRSTRQPLHRSCR
jgi:acyl-CoA synthetase (AMP-forming)/AMP-acid ligase II